MKEWVDHEMATADLGDNRLLERMKQILNRLAESPMASLKSAFRGWAELIGAYRFFDNVKTSVAKILKPHRDATVERVKEFKRVLVVQDTTELDYTKKKKLAGTGPLSATSRKGFFAHQQLVVTPERLSLGVWNTQIYARDESEHGKSKKRKQKPIEEKESYRWLEGYRDACTLAEQVPNTQVISCGDRENDIYEVFAQWHERLAKGQRAADWLIRSRENRAIVPDSKKGKDEGKIIPQKLRENVNASPLLGTLTIRVKEKFWQKKVKGTTKKTKRSARVAILEVKAAKVPPRPPYRKGKKLPKVSFWVVRATEKHPPKGEDPIDWVLLTSLAVPDFDSAKEILELYLARWEIEVFFRVLKTGCKVEELQLKEDDRIKVAIALYMVVAWRVLYVMKLGRECPDLPCDVVFEEEEWKGLWSIAHGPEALARMPSLGEFVKKVAEFGGYLGRKGDGPPGPQSIWQGMIALKYFAISWQVLVKKTNHCLCPTCS